MADPRRRMRRTRRSVGVCLTPNLPQTLTMKITYPLTTHPDTGIHTVYGNRLKIWHEVDDRKQYLTLPPGTTIDEARARRDELYRTLAEQGARPVTVAPRTRKPTEVSWKPGKYTYERKPSTVRIRGHQIGEFTSKQEAQDAVNQWFDKEGIAR